MAFSFTEVLLLLITVIMAVMAGVVVVVGMRLASTLSRIQETSERLNALEPVVRRVLTNVEEELERVESLTAKTDRVAEDVMKVTGESRRVALGLIHDLEDLQIPDRYRAAMAGARAGLSVLRAANGKRR